jgi:hypothetical protein
MRHKARQELGLRAAIPSAASGANPTKGAAIRHWLAATIRAIVAPDKNRALPHKGA